MGVVSPILGFYKDYDIVIFRFAHGLSPEKRHMKRPGWS